VAVMSFVGAQIATDRQEEVRQKYSEMVDGDLPPVIRETYLLAAEDGTMAIATVWRSREDLEAVRSSPEEPFARRVLREAGGDPHAQFFEVIAEAPRR
jgi:heme-degrading monooxygenase HmoA